MKKWRRIRLNDPSIYLLSRTTPFGLFGIISTWVKHFRIRKFGQARQTCDKGGRRTIYRVGRIPTGLRDGG